MNINGRCGQQNRKVRKAFVEKKFNLKVKSKGISIPFFSPKN